MAAIVQLVDLVKSYGRSADAVAGLNLEVPEGSIFGLVGPNGAGKTTTMKIMATLLAPTRGQVWVGGHEVSRQPAQVRDRVGYMPDFFGVYDDLKVSEYLEFYGATYDIPAAKRRRLADDLLDLVDLTEKKNAYVDTLSRGMKQRLCLARALIHDPQVLILDEPASGLDPRARVEMRELLKELREMGKTVIISSHILSELGEVCTEIAIIDRGSLVASGTPEEILVQLNATRVLEIRVLSDPDAAAAFLAQQPGVGQIARVNGASLRVGFNGDDQGAAALLGAMVGAGLRPSSFAQAANTLEDLFLKVTGQNGQGGAAGDGGGGNGKGRGNGGGSGDSSGNGRMKA